ncbi:MAG: hypothetical protein ACOZCO_15195 [Bacteroidota bacterium]
MKHLYLKLPVFLFFFASCGGESNNPSGKNEKDSLAEKGPEIKTENGKYYFQGMINHKYSLFMKFDYYEGKVNGLYFYDSQKKELDVDGTIENGQLELDEKVNEKITGHFSGKIYGMDSVSGTWKSPKGKEMEFALYKSDEFDYSTHLHPDKERRWRPEDVEDFAKRFISVELPLEFTAFANGENSEPQFTDEGVRKFIDDTYRINTDDFEMNTYHPRYVYKSEKFYAFIYIDHYYPGAFGIDNTNVVLMTISKDGFLIDSEYIGCSCYDSNMGANDFYSTDDSFMWTKNQIKVTSKQLYATLYEEEGVESFSEEKTEYLDISIDEDGNIEAGKYYK